ncbi:hypothetical protein STAS_33529 [Striga asiatica]|uniref:Uncharacterized protein n=1 Tax=Striga asiatica TaxID=4170 RepID=A0A5A7RF70_STRAF|nr:hypothetical protein STAS_33529 [Striga asiatica]
MLKSPSGETLWENSGSKSPEAASITCRSARSSSAAIAARSNSEKKGPCKTAFTQCRAHSLDSCTSWYSVEGGGCGGGVVPELEPPREENAAGVIEEIEVGGGGVRGDLKGVVAEGGGAIHLEARQARGLSPSAGRLGSSPDARRVPERDNPPQTSPNTIYGSARPAALGVHEEPKPSPRPRHDGPAQPLYNLAQIIRAADPLKKPTPGHPVPIPTFLQPHQHAVRPDVRRRTADENRPAGGHPPPEPPVSVEIGVLRHPPRLQVGVQQVEHERHRRDAGREPGSAAAAAAGLEVEAEGVDEGAVEVVEEEGGDEGEGAGVAAVPAVGEEEKGEPDGGALHEEPGERRGEGGAPSGAAVAAVGGREEEEGDDGGGRDEEEGEEAVPEKGLVGEHFLRRDFGFFSVS